MILTGNPKEKANLIHFTRLTQLKDARLTLPDRLFQDEFLP